MTVFSSILSKNKFNYLSELADDVFSHYNLERAFKSIKIKSKWGSCEWKIDKQCCTAVVSERL
jgi:hypothetical protein